MKCRLYMATSNMPFFLAVNAGQTEVVAVMLNFFPEDSALKLRLLTTVNSDGYTPLSWAVEIGHFEVIKVLLNGLTTVEENQQFFCNTTFGELELMSLIPQLTTRAIFLLEVPMSKLSDKLKQLIDTAILSWVKEGEINDVELYLPLLRKHQGRICKVLISASDAFPAELLPVLNTVKNPGSILHQLFVVHSKSVSVHALLDNASLRLNYKRIKNKIKELERKVELPPTTRVTRSRQ